MTDEMIVDKYGVSRRITAHERIARTMATMPRIEVRTGRPLPIAEQPEPVQSAATVDGVPYEPPVPNLGSSIVKVAQEMNVDPTALLDDEGFVNGIAALDPDDLAGISQAITASSVRPAMRPNPAQGRSSTPPLSAETPADKVRRMVANSSTSGDNFTRIA